MTIKIFEDKHDEAPVVYSGNVSCVYNDDKLHDLSVYIDGKAVATWETARVVFQGNFVLAYREWSNA